MPRITASLAIRNTIAALRAAREITQQDLADEIGVTRATIVAIEKGNYNPSLELAFRIARFFKCGIEDVFTAKGA